MPLSSVPVEKAKSGPFRPALLESLAGLVAGGATALFMSPLDNVRTRLQLQSTLDLPASMKARGAVEGVKIIAKQEGWKGFFRGLSSSGVAIPVFWACYFPIYSWSKDFLHEKFPSPPSSDGSISSSGSSSSSSHLRSGILHALAAINSAIVCDTLINPLFVARIRMQTEWMHHAAASFAASVQIEGSCPAKMKREYRGPFQTLLKMAREEGLRSWYSGLVPTFLGASQVALQLPIYEAIKRHLTASELKFLSVPEEELGEALAIEAKQRSRFAAAEVDTDLELVTASAIVAADLVDPASVVLPANTFDGDEAEGGGSGAQHHHHQRQLAGSLSTSVSTAVQVAEKYRPEIAQGTTSAASVTQSYRPSAAGLMLASVVSKLVASAVTYPHEVIRARLQDERRLKTTGAGAAGGSSDQKRRYRGVIDCASKTYQAEGLRGLWAGFSVNLIRALPAVVVTFYAYETSLQWLKSKVDKDGNWQQDDDDD